MRSMKVSDLIFVILFCFFANFLMPISSWTACTGSSPNWISTADYESVNSCVSQASPEDVITISGNDTWTSTLRVTRGVRLIGSGNPTITGKRKLILWQPDATAQAAHETLKISNIIFDADGATNAELNYHGIITTSTPATSYVYLVANNNTFKNTTGTGIYVSGSCYGVAYSNTFDSVGMPIRNMGSNYDSWNNETQAYGIAQNFYFEDNTISGDDGWIETGQGGRIVVRYNTWDLTGIDGSSTWIESWDIHGLQNGAAYPGPYEGTCMAYSTMVAEYYGNNVINTIGLDRGMYQRGGWMLMFYNNFSGDRFPTPFHLTTQYFCNSCQQTGSFNQKSDNTYVWRNLANGNDKPLVYSPYSGPAGSGCESDPVVENADFFNYSDSFNGATGVGCGTLASRPATCTTGVAYWATDQSCSDLTLMVGTNPTTPISGTLYKCTAPNEWTAYYTPYTYPHPLRKPSPPQNYRFLP